MVTNFAAGISPHALTHEEVLVVMKEMSEGISRLIMATLAEMPVEMECGCLPELKGM
jgi:5'-methylthioadenosine phosphorylase